MARELGIYLERMNKVLKIGSCLGDEGDSGDWSIEFLENPCPFLLYNPKWFNHQDAANSKTELFFSFLFFFFYFFLFFKKNQKPIGPSGPLYLGFMFFRPTK